MDLQKMIGEPVTHKLPSLGNGTITDAFEKDRFKYIQVSFPAAGKELTFVFPDVFTESKLLSSDSSVIADILDEVTPKPVVSPPTPKPKLKPRPAAKDGSSGTYGRFEREYPRHAVIMREGAFYSAHNESARVLAHAMDYKLGIDMYGRPTTGGPDANSIEAGLRAVKFSFVIVENKAVTTRFDGRDPFKFLNLKDVADTGDADDPQITAENVDSAPQGSASSVTLDDLDWLIEFDEEIAKNGTPYYKSLYPYVPVYMLQQFPDYAKTTYAILDYKNMREPAFSKATQELIPVIVEMVNESKFGNAILVPVPTSQVGHIPATSESIRIITSKNLHDAGLTAEKAVYSGRGLLQRIKDVPKAHLQKSDERATVDVHVESMKCGRDILPDDCLYVLMDDIVTSGTQLRACKQVLMGCGISYENIVAVTVGETFYPPVNEGELQ